MGGEWVWYDAHHERYKFFHVKVTRSDVFEKAWQTQRTMTQPIADNAIAASSTTPKEKAVMHETTATRLDKENTVKHETTATEKPKAKAAASKRQRAQDDTPLEGTPDGKKARKPIDVAMASALKTKKMILQTQSVSDHLKKQIANDTMFEWANNTFEQARLINADSMLESEIKRVRFNTSFLTAQSPADMKKKVPDVAELEKCLQTFVNSLEPLASAVDKEVKRILRKNAAHHETLA